MLGIDETRRGKPIWARDPVTGRWHVLHDRWSGNRAGRVTLPSIPGHASKHAPLT